MPQPTSVRSAHFTQRFSPAFCLLLLAALPSAGYRAHWRAVRRAVAPPAFDAQANRLDLLFGSGASQLLETRILGRTTAAKSPRAQSAVDARAQADKVDE